MPVGTTFAAAETAIRERFETEFPLLFPDTQVFYDNQRVKQPVVPSVIVPGDELKSCWVQLHVVWGDNRQAELGVSNPRFRAVGLVVTKVFAPSGRGSGAVTQIVDGVVEIFRRVRLDGMTFRAPSPFRVGHGEDDGWYQVNVNAPMIFDAIPL